MCRRIPWLALAEWKPKIGATWTSSQSRTTSGDKMYVDPTWALVDGESIISSSVFSVLVFLGDFVPMWQQDKVRFVGNQSKL